MRPATAAAALAGTIAIASSALAAPPLFDVPWIGYDTAYWPEGLYPYDAEVGDLNGGGAPDLAVVCFLVGTPYLNVLFGDGAGGYLPPVTYETPLESAGLDLLDYDLDGDLDLAISDTDRFFGGFTVSIWANDGAGAFTIVDQYLIGDTGPAGIVAGDWDGDGWPDLATANDGDIECNNTVAILRNVRGTGFSPWQLHTIANCPHEIDAGDVDGDGDLDLVIGHDGPNGWTKLINDGSGAFSPSGFTTGIPSGSLVGNPAMHLADVDLDGDLDALYSQNASGGLEVGAIGLFRNNGDGSFAPGETLSFEFYNGGGVDITSGDVTGDGWPDLLAVTPQSNWFLFPGDGAGGFAAPSRFRAGHGPNSLRLSDLDSDGDLDVTIIGTYSLEACVYLNAGDGAFVHPPVLDMSDPATAPSFTTNIEAGDLDGDGDLDLVSGYRSDFTGTNGLSVRLNNGDGTFAPRANYAESPYPTWVQLDDMDGDGDLDLLYLDANARFSIRKNDGAGAFGPRLPRHQLTAQADAMQIKAVDVDGDGDLDVCGNTGFNLRISRNNGNDSYGIPYVAASLGIWVQTFTFGDVNDDGRVDLVTDAGSQVAEVRVCLGTGSGTFGSASSVSVTERDVHSIRLADLNGDGHLDLTAIHDRTPKGLTVRLGNGNGTFQPMQSYNSSFFFDQYTPGGTTAIVDVDADGHDDILFANTFAQDFSFWRNAGDGTFEDHVRYGVGHDAHDLAAGDVDGDGRIDVTIATQEDDGQWFYAGAVIITNITGGPARRAGDVNSDGVVDADDLVAVITAWGPCAGACSADVAPHGTPDGMVNVDDLVMVIANWG